MTIPVPDLHGRVAIVTGASRGIGKAFAEALGRAGCAVVCAAKSESEKEGLPGTIHMTADSITSAGGKALAVRCNVRHEEEVQALVGKTLESYGRIDILVNNAGALWWRGVEETPSRRFDLLLDVNLRGPFLLAQSVMKSMKDQGEGGHIVNLAPPFDPRMMPGKTPYMISKFGMTMLTYGLAGELHPHNIAVNNLWPATAIESQATINHQLGQPENWRTTDILCDSLFALLNAPMGSITGRDLIDEDWLTECGVIDLAPYSCVPGGELLYIHGEKAIQQWKDRSGSIRG
ncbi:MAG: SDR family oxidoreductase [Planctomycetes bacterium]|nr:SDR family oxidoreductase [Planctomycetota bacterium]